MLMYSYCYVCFVLCIVSLCCSVYCLCVKLYCSAATGCQPNCSYQNYHIPYQFVTVDHTDRLGQHSFITTHYIHCHDIITEFDSNFYLFKCVWRNMCRNYTETYLITPCSIILWEKLISQLVTVYLTFYGTELLLPLSWETATTPCSGQLNAPHVIIRIPHPVFCPLLELLKNPHIALAAIKLPFFNIGVF
jgi:hypothetical protein